MFAKKSIYIHKEAKTVFYKPEVRNLQPMYTDVKITNFTLALSIL